MKRRRNLSIFNNGKIFNLIEDKERLFIARAKFLDENHLILPTFKSNLSFMIKIKNFKKRAQISQSKVFKF